MILTTTFYYAATVSIHQRHLQFLVTEIFKTISQINLEFMWLFFKQKKLFHNLRALLLTYQELNPPTTVEMLFTFEVPLYGTAFLLK